MLKPTFAAIVESLQGTFSKLTFTPSTQVYDVAGKRVLPPDTVRTIVDKQIAASGNKLEKLGDDLRAVKGQPGWDAAVDRWAVQFREERRALELQCSSAGRGGLHSTSLEAFDRAEANNKIHFAHHDDLVKKLKDDPDYVDSGRFGNCGDGYARRCRLSYENERVEGHKDNGFKFVIRWTHSANPCPTCSGLDGVETPIEESTPLGVDCECEGFCDCTQEITKDSQE